MEDKRQIRATAVGVDQILNVWDGMNDGFPYFAVFYNRSNKYFQYNKPDLEAARNYLAANLQALQDSGDNAMYYLNIYSEAKVNYKNSDMICSFPFRLNEYESKGLGSPGGGDLEPFARMLQQANDKQLELAREIAELKAENQPLDWFDKIGGILEHPQAAGVIVPLLQPVISGLMGLVSKFSGITANQQLMSAANPVIGSADIGKDLDQVIDAALDRLEKHGDLAEMLTTLADFADQNPDQFKMYFKMLRK